MSLSRRFISFGIIFVIVTFWVAPILGIELTNVYLKDYSGLINRTVLVFSDEINFGIELDEKEQQITVNLLDNINLDYVRLPHIDDTSIIENIELNTEEDVLKSVIIKTKAAFRTESLTLSGQEFKLVFDIFTKKEFETPEDKFAFGKFYFAMSKYPAALKHFNELISSFTLSNSTNYYLGYIAAAQNETAKGIEYLSRVTSVAPEYPFAQYELWKLGATSFPLVEDIKNEEVRSEEEEGIKKESSTSGYGLKDFAKGAITAFIYTLIALLIGKALWKKRETELLKLLKEKDKDIIACSEAHKNDEPETPEIEQTPNSDPEYEKKSKDNDNDLAPSSLTDTLLRNNMIKALKKEGWNNNEIAKEVGCTLETVEKILEELQ